MKSAIDRYADAVRGILAIRGLDARSAGLRDTPRRVARAFLEMTTGYDDDPAAILATRFHGNGYDQMVLLRGVAFTSLCEHHLLPFVGTAHVAYIPNENVVGLSKLARLVDCYTRRLQLQERLTRQIADALEEHLKPLGVAVLIEAAHSCMGVRGVRKPEARMTTSDVRGVFREKPAARAEFLALARS